MFSPGLTFPPRVGGVQLGPTPLSKGGSFYTGWPLAFDFVNNKYRVGVGRGYSSSFLEQPGVTYARTGADLLSYNPVTGKWQAFAANIPPILSGAGMDVPEGTTNKCTNYNAAPDAGLTSVSKSGDAAATLTRVDDTAALRAAGFGDLIDAGKMSGMVYKLDNSAGSTSAFANISGATGNTNSHIASAFMRGSGSVFFSGAGALGIVSGRNTYARVFGSGTPSGTTVGLQIRTLAGEVCYFILNQLEEKAYATNPVIVSGASATRGNAQPVVTGLSSILTPPFTLVAVANLSAIDGVNRYLAALSAGGSSTERLRILRTSTQDAFLATGGAAIGVFSGKSGPHLLKTAIRLRPSVAKGSVDGVLGPDTFPTNPVGMDRLDLGAINGGGTSLLNSPLLFVGIAPDLTDAQLQAITASNGALTDFL